MAYGLHNHPPPTFLQLLPPFSLCLLWLLSAAYVSSILFSCDFVSDCHECLSKMLNCAVQKDARHSTFFFLQSDCFLSASRPLSVRFKVEKQFENGRIV